MPELPPFLRPDVTGEVRDARDVPSVVRALVAGEHPHARSVIDVGELRLPSGEIAVVDPVRHVHKQPLASRAPIGRHPTSLILGASGDVAAAMIVRFSNDRPARVERATFRWPFADEERFSLPSGYAAVFAYREVDPFVPLREAELAPLRTLAVGTAGNLVALPRVRKWNAALCRAPTVSDGFYTAWWALAADDEPVALIVDFAALGDPD